MSDPATRPLEIDRIKQLAGGDPYRSELLTQIGILMERSDNTQRWMRDHDRRDDDRFSELAKNIGSVKSSADDYSDTMAQFKGGWKALGGLVLVGATAYGCVQALAWILEKLKP